MPHSQHTTFTLADIRHPDYMFSSTEWTEWRETFNGGQDYLDNYLMKFSDRETESDFNFRKSVTPITTFAKAAVLDIRNSIFQRLGEISRTGGSTKYQRSVNGEGPGVDRNGASMNQFMGIDVLTELLVMGRCGIYVDAPDKQPTLLSDPVKSPYLYYYPVEDVLSWTLDDEAEDGTFKAVLLRDTAIKYNENYDGIQLPNGRETEYRLVWRGDDGIVRCRIYDLDKQVIFYENSDDSGAFELGIPVVPFIMPDIGGSVLADTSSYQKALLNVSSSNIDWLLRACTPFLTIQAEMRTAGAHLKKPADGAEPGAQPARNNRETLGGVGRYYDVGMERPGYIAPPTGPLETSLKYQEKLEDDIRKLINLAVANKTGSRTESAEAKKLSSQGLEAGLSFIGLVLERAEQAIARYWGMYENKNESTVAKIKYPSRYILKADSERLEEAKQMMDLIDRMPGKAGKKVMLKQVATLLMAGKEDVETMEKVLSAIDSADYTSSDLQIILQSQEAGLVDDETAAEALGFDPKKVEDAREDRAERVVLTLRAQTSPEAQGGEEPGGITNPGARGAPELETNPNSAAEEQEEGREDAELR